MLADGEQEALVGAEGQERWVGLGDDVQVREFAAGRVALEDVDAFGAGQSRVYVPT